MQQRVRNDIVGKRAMIKRLEAERLADLMRKDNKNPSDLRGVLWTKPEPYRPLEPVDLAPRTQEIIRDLAAGDYLAAVEDTAVTALSAAVFYDKVFNEPWDALLSGQLNDTAWALVTDLSSPPVGIKIPEGTKWDEGPCGTYVDLGLTVNFVAAQYCGVCTFNGAAPDYAPATDAEINFALTGGSVVGLWHKEPYGLVPGTWAYSGFGTISTISPPFHEPWDSNIHGKYIPATKAIPLRWGVDDAVWFDPLNKSLAQLGLRQWQSPEDMWKQVVETFGPPASWTREGLVFRPPRTGKWPWWKYPPKPNPDPFVPPALNNKGSLIVNKFTRVNKGFRKRPEKKVKEVKPKGERALWRALSVAGKYSEFQDAVKALYKGLPRDLRRQFWKDNGGREPRPEEKVLLMLMNLDKMNWTRALEHLAVSQIDDMIAAMTSHDNLFRSTHRRFTGRMLSRAAWNEMLEGHPELEAKAPSLEKWLEEKGYLEK